MNNAIKKIHENAKEIVNLAKEMFESREHQASTYRVKERLESKAIVIQTICEQGEDSIIPSVRELYEQEDLELMHKAMSAYKSTCLSRARRYRNDAPTSGMQKVITAEGWEEKAERIDNAMAKWEEHYLS